MRHTVSCSFDLYPEWRVLSLNRSCSRELRSAGSSQNFSSISEHSPSISVISSRTRYVELEELLVEETWLEVLPGELQKSKSES